MKTVNKILSIAVMVFGLASVVLFFTDFAQITAGEQSNNLVGAVLAFGSKTDFAGTKYNMEISGHILLNFVFVALATVLSFLAPKSKKVRYTVPVLAIIASIYMFVIRLSDAVKFVDARPIEAVTKIAYEPSVLIVAILLAVFAVLAIAYLLLDDYIEVLASKGEKLTIPKRIVRFFRDYKSEVKKIVWPGWKDVFKNTAIVLIMCLIVGILIWLVDFGLAELINLILGVK